MSENNESGSELLESAGHFEIAVIKRISKEVIEVRCPDNCGPRWYQMIQTKKLDVRVISKDFQTMINCCTRGY